MPKRDIFHSFFVIGKDNFAIFEKLKVMLAFAGRKRRRQRGGCVCGAASQRRMDVSGKGVTSARAKQPLSWQVYVSVVCRRGCFETGAARARRMHRGIKKRA